MTWPNVDKNTQDRPRPLKFHVGDENSKSVVVCASTVTQDDDGRRLLTGGTLLCKITSGHCADKYGPYSKTASDGRQTIAELSAVFTLRGYDLALGDKAVEGLFADCVFDKSELTTGGVSFHGTGLTTLKAAFPQCTFDD